MLQMILLIHNKNGLIAFVYMKLFINSEAINILY